MLWTLVAVFFTLWILGLGNVYTIGAWIWLFFVIWVIALIAAIVTHGRTATPPPDA